MAWHAWCFFVSLDRITHISFRIIRNVHFRVQFMLVGDFLFCLFVVVCAPVCIHRSNTVLLLVLPIQDAVINELKSKTNAVRETKLLHQDEVYNGALEDILLGLKSEPYRRADAVRRSQRRRIDNRLSRAMDEIDV